jgi:hypothetical protein
MNYNNNNNNKNNSNSNNFELKIENYNKTELEDIFELKPNNYDRSMIEMKESKLRENILIDRTITDLTRNKTLNFLTEAKNTLLANLKTTLHNISTQVLNTDHSLKPVDTLNAGSTFIIEKPPTPYSQSFPSLFYPGTINPLKKRTINQNLNIDTRFRSNYYSTLSTDFQFDLPIKFSNVMTMQLSAFEMPTTYYAISKQMGNNFFSIVIGTNNLIIKIPDGNYTPIALISFINNYLYNYSGDSSYNNIDFSINTDLTGSGSGQMIVGLNAQDISNNIPPMFSFTLNFQTDINGNPDHSTPLPLKLGWMMGFRQGVYKNNYSYVSEGIVDLTGSRYIYLVIDDYNNNVNNGFYSAFNSSLLNKNILARISIQSGTFNLVSHNNLNIISPNREYFGPVDIQKMNIQLLDEYGRILDLNNMDYSFCLIFQSVYDL